MLRQIHHVLRQARRRDETLDLHGAFVLDQRPDGQQEFGGELRVPPVLPGDEPGHRRDGLPRVLLSLEVGKEAREGSGGEPDREAPAIRLDGFLLVMESSR